MNLMMLLNIADMDFTKPIEALADKFQFGGTILALGLGTVFSVLILLWLVLSIFNLCFHVLPSKKKAKKVKEVVVTEPVLVDKPTYNDGEIIAAIAAAIAMAESESDGVKFRVVSFRRR